MAVQSLTPTTTPDANLSRYLREIRQFPMLTAEEETALARRVRDSGCRESAHRLVNSHLRLVAKIAMGFRGYGLPLGELIGEGNIGMMQAVERFDPERGFRLATYAMWWIRAAIQEYVLHSWSLVKIGTTAAQKKLFFNLRKLKNQIRAVEEGDLSPEQVSAIAERLDVPEHEVVSMNRRISKPDGSLNVKVQAEAEGEWLDWLEDEGQNQEERLADSEEFAFRRAMLTTALKDLRQRERRIFVARRLRDQPSTLDALSRRYGISRERVRQIEVRAFKKLQKSICATPVEA